MPPTPPPRPPLVGLIAWYKGDAGLESSGGLATAWLDQTEFGQDLDQNDGATFQPSVGVPGDVVDGIPAISFPLNVDSHTYLYREQNLRDSDGNDVQIGPLTCFCVCKPRFSLGAFSITGGPAFTIFNEIRPHFTCLFDLESNFVAGGAYGWSNAWRDPGTALEFGPITGGAGGPFDNVPTLLEWRSTGYPNIQLLVNNALKTLTPSTMYTGGSPGLAGFMVGNCLPDGFGLNFLGSHNEWLIYDEDLAADAPKHAQVVAYLQTRFPSLVLS